MHTTSYWFTIPKDRLTPLPYTQAEIMMACPVWLTACIISRPSCSWLIYMISTAPSVIKRRMVCPPWVNICGRSRHRWRVHGYQQMTSTRPWLTPSTDGFIFDAYPGGIGFAELLFEEHQRLLSSTRHLIGNCPCSHGCPTCVGPTLEIGLSAKAVALAIID